MTQRVAQGATAALDATFYDSAGTLVDPVSPLVDIFDSAGVAVVTDGVPTRTSLGRYVYNYAVPLAAPLGVWRTHWTGTIDGVAASGNDTFEVVAAGEVIFAPGYNWITVADLALCEGIAAGVDKTAAIAAASEVLYVLSGRQFGPRTEKLRPSVHRPTCQWWEARHVNGSARTGACGCCLDELTLEGPVRSIEEVRVDGAVLVATSYALYDKRRLVRLDGKAWPCGQDLSDPITAAGTMQVSYTYGADVPEAGLMAAAELACQLALGASGSGDCRLPQRVQSITRQGVSMVMLDPQDFLDQGRTGLYLVDLFLSTYNPAGARRRATVWSPDINRGARSA